MGAPLSQKNNGPGRWRDRLRGASLFEFVLCVAVLAVIFGVFLGRSMFYAGQAHEKATKRTLNELRSALMLQEATFLAHGEGSRAAQLVDQNPMRLLARPPANYLGEYYSPDVSKLQRGSWLYDRSAKSLIYLLNNGETFGGRQSKMLKFKVKLMRSPDQAAAAANNQSPQPVLVEEQASN